MVKLVLQHFKVNYHHLKRDILKQLKLLKLLPNSTKNVAKAADFVRNDLPDLEQRLANATATVNANLPTLFDKYDNAVDLLDENQPKAKEALANLANFAQNKITWYRKRFK